MDGRMGGWMDGWMDGRMGGWAGRKGVDGVGYGGAGQGGLVTRNSPKPTFATLIVGDRLAAGAPLTGDPAPRFSS
eukprot:362836-Chlamydomonas_euryale.AAC.1